MMSKFVNIYTIAVLLILGITAKHNPGAETDTTNLTPSYCDKQAAKQ